MQPGEPAGPPVTRRRARADQLRAAAAESLRQAEAADRRAEAAQCRAEAAQCRAERWEPGPVGEQAIGARLDGLRDHGYDVLHDLRWPGRRSASIDNVAIGPAGILVVEEAKNWSDDVSPQGRQDPQDGYARDRELDGVRRAGVDVAELLELPWALHVIPVLCVSAGQRVTPARCGEVTVLAAGHLREWVAELPQNLTPGDVLRVAADLRGQLPAPAAAVRPHARRRRARAPTGRPAAAPRQPSTRHRRAKTPTGRPAPAPRQPSSPHRRKKPVRTVAGVRRVLVKLAFSLLVVLTIPATLYWWSAHGPGDAGAPAPRPPAAASPRTTVYDSCRELRTRHPGGVRRPGALNTGRKLQRSAVVTTSQSLYAANARLDSDRDGIACELVRKGPNAQ